MRDHHPAFPRTGATADLPAGTPAPEQDMGQTRALLLEMARCQSLDQIFRLVAETFAARQDVALCRIWLLEQTEPSLCASCRHFYDCRDHRQCLRLAASTGRSRVDGHAWTALDGEHSRFSLGLGKVGLIAQSGTAYHVDAVRPDMDWVTSPDWIRREGIRTFLGQPLVHRGRVLGVFAVFSREVQDAQAMDRLRMIADYLAVSIANAQAFEELTRLKRQLEIENAYLKNDALPPAALALTGDSPCMRTLKEKIRQVACTDVPVLITGEAGSGKKPWPPSCTGKVSWPAGRWCGSTVPPSRPTVSKTSSSAMRPAWAFWRPPRAGRSSWMPWTSSPASAGQAPARPAGQGVSPRRRGQRTPAQRAPRGRHQPRPLRAGACGAFPRRPLLPPQRLPHPHRSPA